MATPRSPLSAGIGRRPAVATPLTRRDGYTLLEVIIAGPIILIAGLILISTMTAASNGQANGLERARAIETLRSVVEKMRNEDFEDVLSLYNADPFDDPGGPGTAPGQEFWIDAAPGLEAPGGGPPGRVRLPLVDVSEDAVLPVWELREDMVDERLGMPRDLDGNGGIDDIDHSTDFRILPVIVEVEWTSELGPRSLSIFTLLTDFEY